MRWLILFLLLVPCVFASDIKLLALQENGLNKSGVTVDLHLDIKDGSGKVYLETVPLSQTTTQVSMRFAEQMACNDFDFNCSQYDFFFTIISGAPIISGPSAGGAAAVLVAADLMGLELSEDVAMTGTINSGGLIGFVGGVKEKIEGAANAGMTRVLIPKDSAIQEVNGIKLDVIKYGEELGVEVIEVATLREALSYFTSFKDTSNNQEFNLDPQYVKIMETIANDLCSRAGSDNFSRLGKEKIAQNKFYSAASFCFRSSVNYYADLYANYSNSTLNEMQDKLGKQLIDFKEQVSKKDIKTINDLQTYMAVMERIDEANSTLINTSTGIAYTQERLVSANSWASFFGTGSAIINKDRLKKSCEDKIAEAEERSTYVSQYIPQRPESLDEASRDNSNGDYISCLNKASKAKSESDIILSAIGAEKLNDLLDIKLNAVKKSIIKAQSKGIFPIISYSYYEYADSLREIDPASGLLFAEYALEMSNLDIYFKDATYSTSALKQQAKANSDMFYIFLLGISVGLLCAIIFWYVLNN